MSSKTMRKQTILSLLLVLVTASPAWADAFEEGRRAYLRGDDLRARTLLRQAVKERPRDPVRHEWLAKLYDRMLQPLAALQERDAAARLRARYYPQRVRERARIRITPSVLAALPPMRPTVSDPAAPQAAASAPAAPSSAAPTSLAKAEGGFMGSLGPSGGKSGGFEVLITAMGNDSAAIEAKLKSIKQVEVKLTAGDMTQSWLIPASQGTVSGSTLKLTQASDKVWAGSSASQVDTYVQVGDDQVSVPSSTVRQALANITLIGDGVSQPLPAVKLSDSGLVFLTQPPKPYRKEGEGVQPPKLPG